VTEMVPAECSGKELEPQALLSSQTYSDLNVSQEFAGGMMKIVPSDADVSISQPCRVPPPLHTGDFGLHLSKSFVLIKHFGCGPAVVFLAFNDWLSVILC
jgi:hypothetical protein